MTEGEVTKGKVSDAKPSDAEPSDAKPLPPLREELSAEPKPEFTSVDRVCNAILLALAALALLLYVVGLHGWPRQVIAIVVLTFLPGQALLTYLPPLPSVLRAPVSAAISLALLAFGAFLLILSGYFHPWVLIWTGIPAAMVIVWLRGFGEKSAGVRVGAFLRHPGAESSRYGVGFRDAAGRLFSTRATWRAGAALLCATALWGISVTAMNVTAVGDRGLVDLLPYSWYLAFGLVLGAIVFYSFARRPHAVMMSALVLGFVGLVYATTPAVLEAPHLPWVYKHVGVVRMFLDLGHSIKDVDIYNRWPAMFAMGGVFTRMAGASTPIQFVQWAELYFIAIQTSLVGAIAWHETKRVGTAGVAAMFFVLLNWIGQAYFSPQAVAFTLMLAVIAIAFTQLSDNGNRVTAWFARLIGKIVRREQHWVGGRADPEWNASTAIAVLLLLAGAVVITHQLTPYVLLIAIGALAVCGLLKRPWLLVGGLIVLTLAYLLPNLMWVNDHFGLFTKFDPFANVQRTTVIEYACSPGCHVSTRAYIGSAAGSWLAAVAGSLILARRQPSFRVLFFGLIFLSPFATVLGQNYGGEAGLRVIMFTSAPAAIIIAAAIFSYRARLRALLLIAATAFFAWCFVNAYFGDEQTRYVKKADVAAVEYLYKHAPKGSVVISVAPNLPALVSPNYYNVITPVEGFYIDSRLRARPLGLREANFLADELEAISDDGFFATSPRMEQLAESKGMLLPGQLANLERAMIESGRFKLWYDDGEGGRIYRLVPGKAAEQQPAG